MQILIQQSSWDSSRPVFWGCIYVAYELALCFVHTTPLLVANVSCHMIGNPTRIKKNYAVIYLCLLSLLWEWLPHIFSHQCQPAGCIRHPFGLKHARNVNTACTVTTNTTGRSTGSTREQLGCCQCLRRNRQSVRQVLLRLCPFCSSSCCLMRK